MNKVAQEQEIVSAAAQCAHEGYCVSRRLASAVSIANPELATDASDARKSGLRASIISTVVSGRQQPRNAADRVWRWLETNYAEEILAAMKG